jgi:ribosome-associated protein
VSFNLPEHLIEETFLASTGPGGQNVNKVATACQLRVDVYALGLAPSAFRQLKEMAGSKTTSLW